MVHKLFGTILVLGPDEELYRQRERFPYSHIVFPTIETKNLVVEEREKKFW
jgi:hypothetical protein